MLYKIEEGMELDFIRTLKNGEKQVKTFIVKHIPENKEKKVTVIDKENGKKKQFSLETLKTCKRHIAEKEKKESALSCAIRILKRENRPIHVNELIDLIFKDGYVLPRNGKTFKNTISTSLNKECSKVNGKVKKVHYAVYADIDCNVPYTKKYSDNVKLERKLAFAD